MNLRRGIFLMSALTLVGAVALAGCGKSSNPTNPYGGGGGGVGGGTRLFDSGTLTAPASFSHAFPTAGSVGYHCNFHESLGMVGTVVVSGTATDSIVTVTASGMTFTPSTVNIKPGGIVHWNVTNGTHTVTSDH